MKSIKQHRSFCYYVSKFKPRCWFPHDAAHRVSRNSEIDEKYSVMKSIHYRSSCLLSQTNILRMEMDTERRHVVKNYLLVCLTVRTVQLHFFLNPKFQASSLLLRLYKLVCVRPGRKPKLLIFSCEGSVMTYGFVNCHHR